MSRTSILEQLAEGEYQRARRCRDPIRKLERLSDVTGARFFWSDRLAARYPKEYAMFDGCAEALIAQWEGLAPVVKMPKAKR